MKNGKAGTLSVERRTEHVDRRTPNVERRTENGEPRTENAERRTEHAERRTQNVERKIERAGWARPAVGVALAALILLRASATRAQSASQRGFVEAHGTFFPQDAVSDRQNLVGDLRAREEVFFTPARWLQLAGGMEALVNSHDQVDSSWRVDFTDRGRRRPALAVRRLTATITRGPLTLDLGKQFIRWGKADVITPTDRFAPRDFLNVIDSEFLPVSGARLVLGSQSNTLEGVFVPFFTPSRTPLLDQRWTALPAAAGVAVLASTRVIPTGSQTGVRWSHAGGGYEYSLSYFDGYNHLPNIAAAVTAPNRNPVIPAVNAGTGPVPVTLTSTYPRLRMYGADMAWPTRWMTVKGEAGYFTSTTPATDEYLLYVIQLERQTGEWLLVGGYAGEAVTRSRALLTFAPDRGTARSFLGRASYTIDPKRSAALEAALRQDGAGVYFKGEFSRTTGQHWRTTLTGVLIRGKPDDFLGQYRRNSHLAVSLRYSF
jgi:hypothetical protein